MMYDHMEALRGSTNIYAGLQLFMVDVRTNLFGVRNAKSTRGYDAGKDQRGMMGMD